MASSRSTLTRSRLAWSVGSIAGAGSLTISESGHRRLFRGRFAGAVCGSVGTVSRLGLRMRSRVVGRGDCVSAGGRAVSTIGGRTRRTGSDQTLVSFSSRGLPAVSVNTASRCAAATKVTAVLLRILHHLIETHSKFRGIVIRRSVHQGINACEPRSTAPDRLTSRTLKRTFDVLKVTDHGNDFCEQSARQLIRAYR